MIFIKLKEDIKESCNYPLKNKNKNDNGPIQPIRTWIAENVWFISDSSTVKEVENLHKNKSGENKGEMS